MAYHKNIDRGVFASLDSSANTTITTAGTYYPINGIFSNSPIESFQTTADPAIQYIDAKSGKFEIDWHATAKGDSNGITINVGIKKNGVLVSSSVMGTFLKTANESQALSGTAAVELSENDKIQLVVTSDGDGDIISFDNFTTTIRPFYII